jgi:hypothetical protein
MPTIRIFACLALPAVVLFFGLNHADAQGTPDARQACTPDAMRLCSDVIPDVQKVTACMMAKRSQLSAECRLAMAGGGGHGAHHRGRVHCKRHCG